jgi:phage host-nuclease inhibitor protein Gam
MFDEDCKRATDLKNEAYRSMQQRNHTRKSVEDYQTARREEKRLHKKKKRDFEKGLIELQYLRNLNEMRAFYKKLNQSHKNFQPRSTLCRHKDRTSCNLK